MENQDARGLTDRDKQMLVLERSWFRHSGRKEQAILDRFDLSMSRYYQVLLQLIDRPAALKFDPITVNRLRDQRDRKRAARSGVVDVPRVEPATVYSTSSASAT